MSENPKSPLLVVLIVLVGVLIVLQQTGWQLFPVTQTTAPSALVPQQAARDDMSGGVDREIDFPVVEILVDAIPLPQRTALLANSELFAQMIQQEANIRSALSGAYEAGMHNDKRVKLLMERASERILVESYLGVLTNKNFQGKLPTDEDIEEFYNNNPQRFQVSDRVYLSQIYLSTENREQAAVLAEAQKIHQQLAKDGGLFNELASQYSEHPSKARGGDMGPVFVKDMLPEIREAVLQIEENAISQPLLTKNGVHIIRKGQVIKTDMIALDKVREQIRQALIKDTQNKMRTAIIQKLAEKYPVSIKTENLEDWRQRLETP